MTNFGDLDAMDDDDWDRVICAYSAKRVLLIVGLVLVYQRQEQFPPVQSGTADI